MFAVRSGQGVTDGSSIELSQHLTDDLRHLVSRERVAAFRLCDLGGKVFD
jgi:hypothetical protein